MPRSKAVLLLAATLCLAAAAAEGGKPLVTAITKDPATKLYTAPLKDTRPLVLDLSRPRILSSTCGEPRHTTVTVTADTTDGSNSLHPVSFPAAASCAPASIPELPVGAVGVAGLARSRAALPAQVARAQGVAAKFMLCLPRIGGDDNGTGVATFGGGPLFLVTRGGVPSLQDFTSNETLTYTPFLSKEGSHAYHLPVKAIAVDAGTVEVRGRPLAIGDVVLSTTAPYTALRRDVYRPLANAFDKALERQSSNTTKKAKAVAPFELCYDRSTLNPTLTGWSVPDIDLMLENGKNWTFLAGNNKMVDVDDTTACFGFVKMKREKGGYGEAPAVVLGGLQMENHVLEFDLEKKLLGFSIVQAFTSCSRFNFTRSH